MHKINVGFLPFSLCDYPGHPSCVVFLPGCNYRCPTCHNHSVAYGDFMPHGTIEDVLRYTERHRDWYSGVVITGGEPTLYWELPEIVSEFGRRIGSPVSLNTNGTNPQLVKDCINTGYIGEIALDIKGPWSMYPELSGKQYMDWKWNRDKVLEVASLPETRLRCTKVPILEEKDLEEVKENRKKPRKVCNLPRLQGSVPQGLVCMFVSDVVFDPAQLHHVLDGVVH